MSETQLALTVESNWQDSIDQQLQERLMRPLVQPGLTNTTQLARVIISRSHRLSNRLPLLTELNHRLSNVTPLQAEQTPIVYAQPLPSLDKDFKSLAPQEGSNLQNSTPNKFLIVQAKFAPSGKVNYSPKLSQNSSRVGEKNEVTQLAMSEFQRKDGLEKNLLKENSIDSLSPLAVNGLPIVQAKLAPSIEPTSPFPTSPNSQIYTNPRKSSLPVLQVETDSHSGLEHQSLPSLDKDFKSLAPQEGSNLQNSTPNKFLIVQAKFAPSGKVNYSPKLSQNSSRVGEKNEVTQLAMSEFQRKDGLEKNLLKENSIDSLSPLAVNGLPIVQAKLAPSIEPTSPSPTSPNSQIYTNSRKSSLPVLQVETDSHSGLEHQSLPLLKQQTGDSIFTTAISNTATAATSKLPQQFNPLHVSSNGAQAVTGEHRLAPSLPVVTQMRMTGWTGLETPLILPTSPRSLELGIAANGSQRLATQQYSAGVKPEIPRATEAMNPGTVSRPAATVSQSAVPNVSAIAAFQESSSSPTTTGNQTQIDIDVLADKIERKLMRRLVVENERRGQKRWR